MTDVAEPGGAEDGVDHSVRQNVRVGVAVEPKGMIDAHSAEDQVASGT